MADPSFPSPGSSSGSADASSPLALAQAVNADTGIVDGAGVPPALHLSPMHIFNSATSSNLPHGAVTGTSSVGRLNELHSVPISGTNDADSNSSSSKSTLPSSRPAAFRSTADVPAVLSEKVASPSAVKNQKFPDPLSPVAEKSLNPPLLFPKGRQDSSFLSRWLFAYMNPIIALGAKRLLQPDDYLPLDDQDGSLHIADRIQSSWKAELNRNASNPEKARLWRAIIYGFGVQYLWPGLASLAESIVKIGEALVLGLLLDWFRKPGGSLSEGFLIAFGLALCTLVHAFLHHVEFFLSMRVGMQLRVGFIAAIYQKCLRLSISHTSSTGAIVNLVSNDVQRFEDAAPFAHFIWLAPLEVVLITYFMYVQISWAAFAAVLGVLSLIPIQGWFAKQFGRLRKHTVGFRDERIKSVSDSLAGIMVVKLYAWETPFQSNINSLRDQELQVIRKASVLRAMNEAFYFCSSAVIELFAFVTYWLMDGELTPTKVFTCIVYIQSIRLSMCNFYPKALQFISESVVSFQRIQAFLSLPDMKKERDESADRALAAEVQASDATVIIKNGTFEWGSSPVLMRTAEKSGEIDSKGGPPTNNDGEVRESQKAPERSILRDLNIVIGRGELVSVVGPVGSGKSSLLNAILKEMDSVGQTRIAVFTNRIAYCTQTPFILSGSVRENVTFGRPYEADWFKEVIAACAMERDLSLFSDGELTVIGERGVTLSGGQRARLALARAVYSRADLYLLDDPLSAVDTNVGRHLFEKCLNGILAAKTRILVTHQLQFARRCDKCILLESGAVTAQGLYTSILETATHSKFAQTMLELELRAESGDDEADVDDLVHVETRGDAKKGSEVHVEDSSVAPSASRTRGEEGKVTDKSPADGDKANGSLTKEESSTGTVSWSVYLHYFRSGASAALALCLLALLIIGEAALVGTDYFLSRWSLWSFEEQRKASYVGIFVALAIGTFVISVGRALLYFDVALNSTERLFRDMLQAVFRSPMQFFHENPHGRLMNRFSKDLALSDELLPLTFFDFIQCTFMILGTLVISVVAIPFILVCVPIIGVVFYYLRKFYLITSRQVKRYESVTRSPVYSNIPATLEGLSTVRAYSSEIRFREIFMNFQDENTRIFFSFLSSARWLGLRLDLLSAFFLTVVAFATVAIRYSSLGLSSGIVGLLLSYALQLMGLLQWAVRQSAEVENLMVSVERIIEYTKLKSEAPAETAVKPRDNWPDRGEVIISDMSLQYPSSTQPVLKNISVVFPAGTKIGVVGRTGAGKSSLLQALFRLVEPTPQNSIQIDGLKAGEIGLADLRSRISIIPQEPFCFKGTLRYNIDPFGKYSDADLWRALESVELKHVVEEMPERLESPVAENGSNWSVGERQLICLARAILRNSKLIVMDEATSAVDMRTDALVQRAIRSETGLFATSTVLTIAHRLQTIIDFDYVLVLDAGRVVEFGTPHELLQKPLTDASAWFGRMVNEMGPEAQEQLRSIAVAKALGTTGSLALCPPT
ncbi:hypothetical protein DFJ73DRAFT_827739 [Zopfochytrium polystomum]|nr:hypothetical protein DFJ73DRAFT_827739 [Zopfochytrium polystomum]